MGIRIIAIWLGLFTLNSQAATNSWNFVGSGFWDEFQRWSLTNYPTITDTADYITNSTTKTVFIDDAVAASVQDSLTISNLTIGGVGNSTNTLSLTDMNVGALVPLRLINSLTITNGGVLQIANSMLEVHELSGGTFKVNGALRVLNNATVQLQNAIIASNAVLQFALGTNSSVVMVANNLTLGGTLNITNGGGLAGTTYTLFSYGGTLNYLGLAVGSTPANFTAVIDTNTAGQVNVILTQLPSSGFNITSITRQTNDILISWSTTGVGTTNIVQLSTGAGGGYTTNFVNLSTNIFITGAVTNYLDIGSATNSPSRFYRIRLVP